MNDEDAPVVSDLIFGAGQNETDIAKVSNLLLNEEFKRRKTILDNSQVAPITTVSVIAQIYDIPFLKQWVDEFSEWRTSGDGGKGRQDVVDISKSFLIGLRGVDQSVESGRRVGLLDRIRGRR